MTIYLHHRVETAPRAWKAVAERLDTGFRTKVEAAGGALYGLWRNQIGRPRDEVTAITVWTQEADGWPVVAVGLYDVPDVVAVHSTALAPTLRPLDASPPLRQGNYAFRWFETPTANWDEFLSLCAAAWPGFEAAYDSQVIGLWRVPEETGGLVRSLLLTRRPDLSMWERSKIPQNAAEAEVRDKLSRRYDLCDSTVVYTTTLLTARDREDTARWT